MAENARLDFDKDPTPRNFGERADDYPPGWLEAATPAAELAETPPAKTADGQRAAVLRYLRRFGTITHRQAETFLGCTRVAARVHELRQLGHNIITERVKARNGGRYARYFLAE
jgi:hypothetical protein